MYDFHKNINTITKKKYITPCHRLLIKLERHMTII
jgi:hypothetical protein